MKAVFNIVILLLIGICSVFWQCSPSQKSFQLDAGFPGGNIKVISIIGDTVRLEQDLRDTEGHWFYWSFRVRGAAGRTLNFEFMNGSVISSRGPAVSTDGCTTWRWLGEPDFPETQFQYTFGAQEKETYFCMGMNYTEKDLRQFLDLHKNHPDLRIETLCTSRKGRAVELLRIHDNNRVPDYKILLFSRHHAGEMMATRALEGLIETILSDTDDGRWLRAQGDFFIVPFVDKDGVEDGDQGKNRRPHDHNRDYIQQTYPEIRAITEQVPQWLDGKPVFLLDMHCPMHRGGGDECFHFSGANLDLPDYENIMNKKYRFGGLLKNNRQGTLPREITFSQRTRVTASPAKTTPLRNCQDWGETLPNVIFSSTLETPFANASGDEVNTRTTRELGYDVARTIRKYLEDFSK